MLRTSCRPPRNNPISAWSRTSVRAVSATPAAKMKHRERALRAAGRSRRRRRARPGQKRDRSRRPTTAAVARAALSRPWARLSRWGSSPIRTVPSPIVAAKPSRVIAETAAPATPTACWLELARRQPPEGGSEQRGGAQRRASSRSALLRIVRWVSAASRKRPEQIAASRSPVLDPPGVVDHDRTVVVDPVDAGNRVELAVGQRWRSGCSRSCASGSSRS